MGHPQAITWMSLSLYFQWRDQFVFSLQRRLFLKVTAILFCTEAEEPSKTTSDVKNDGTLVFVWVFNEVLAVNHIQGLTSFDTQVRVSRRFPTWNGV